MIVYSSQTPGTMAKKHFEHKYKDSFGLKMLKRQNYRYFDVMSIGVHAELQRIVSEDSQERNHFRV